MANVHSVQIMLFYFVFILCFLKIGVRAQALRLLLGLMLAHNLLSCLIKSRELVAALVL
jgi:ABC-type uncharacterized transport system permease subunit